MSRRITQEICSAFLNGYKMSKSNSHVTITDEGAELYLHDNKIAKRENGKLLVSMAGWDSVTTRERLNGLPGVSIFQKDWEQYLNGEIIDPCGWYTI